MMDGGGVVVLVNDNGGHVALPESGSVTVAPSLMSTIAEL